MYRLSVCSGCHKPLPVVGGSTRRYCRDCRWIVPLMAIGRVVEGVFLAALCYAFVVLYLGGAR